MSLGGAQIGTFPAAFQAAAPDAVAPIAQVTLLLLLALGLAWCGRRGSSRTLHLLWTATFAFVLALPVVGLIGPSWDVPLLPARGGESTAPAIKAAISATSDRSLTSDPSLGSPVSASTPEAVEAREARVAALHARLAAHADGAGSTATDGGGNAATASAAGSVVRIAWIAWLVGCVLSLVSLAVAAVRLRELVRTARPVRDPAWVREAATLQRRLGLRGAVRLLSGEAVATPMTGGLRHPVILLPASAATWSQARRAVVLTHELIHVRRRDALRQLIRRFVLALYWFHPLAWIASRRAVLASEQACDEEVLALGARPSDYARHLLFFATGLARGPRALALPLARPIAHPSQLERRITAILARQRPRQSLARAALTIAILGATGIFVAAARPVPVQEEATATTGPPPEAPEGAAAARREVVNERAAREAALVAARVAAVRAASPAGAPAAPQEVDCFPSSDSIPPFSFQGDGRLVPGWKWLDGEFTITRSVAGLRLCLRGEGDVALNDEGTAVRSLGDDGWLVIESAGGRTHRLAVTRGPEGIEREWRVNGVRRPFDAGARRWRDLMFTVMNRYRDVWVSHAGGLLLYGRTSGTRDASDLEPGLLELSDLVMREAGRPDLERRLEEAERLLRDVLAKLRRGTQ